MASRSRSRPLPRRAKARSATALVGGIALALGLGATAFGLEATLERPTAPQLLTVRALRALRSYRLVHSVERIGSSPPLLGECREGHFRLPHREYVALVTLSDGRRVVFVKHRLRTPSGARLRVPRAVAEAVLAGCPRLLAEGLATELAARKPTYLGRARVEGAAAYRFLVRPRQPRIELFLARRGLRPLALRYADGRLVGWSELRSRKGR